MPEDTSQPDEDDRQGETRAAGQTAAGEKETRMLGGSPGIAAVGRGPASGEPLQHQTYHHPTAGWGAAKSVTQVLARSREPVSGTRVMLRMNHQDGGFDCPGCAWPDDPKGLHLDICENGIKHATWEMTKKRVGRQFFAAHTVSELAEWSDFALEDAGRLSEPMTYDPVSDTYVPITWADAFALVGTTLRGLSSPDEASFYTSGRLGNEATFLYQLWVREYGTNNLPDCSNMCHEASGRALTASLGTGKGTADLEDWDSADAIFIMGNNAASNAPRMLTTLANAYRRGAQIVHINPLIEAAATRTIVPHEVTSMATFSPTDTGTFNVQVRIGGDLALLRGVAKAVFEAAQKDPKAVDRAFLERHTTGSGEYEDLCATATWAELVHQSGVDEATIRRLAAIYLRSERTIISWCLGISQHENGVDNVREIVNLLLLRGNLGREGTGPSPVRGHSNVQGNRTCGINNRPGQALLDRLAEVCHIDPPRAWGLGTVDTIEAMHRGEVSVFVGMGGNFALAVPDTEHAAEALRRCRLTVQVSTKLNRSHLVHGERALILPCLGHTEKDVQRSGLQGTSVEDSMSMVHLSLGMKEPASPDLLSEAAIIAGMAQATLPGTRTPWRAYVDDYDRIRDTMAMVLDGFEDFNRRVRRPHGFRIHQPARELIFLTDSGLAEFSTAPITDAVPPDGCLSLTTVRSHDQWNTTIYANDDRYRGVKGSRTVVFMNRLDMAERGVEHLGRVDITSIARDGSRRSVYGYQAIEFDIPPGSTAAYMPEINVLCPIGDFSRQSDQPIMKHLIVEIAASRAV